MDKSEEEKRMMKVYGDEEHEERGTKEDDVDGEKKQVGGVRTMPFILGEFSA